LLSLPRVKRPSIVLATVLAVVLFLPAIASAAPTLSITSGPSGPTNDSTPTFGFSVDGAETVECSIAGDFGPCTEADSHTETLPDGSYTFTVRATDEFDESTTETRDFTVDTVAPTVSVTSGPSGPTNDDTPTFGFSVAGASDVECAIEPADDELGECSGASSHTPSGSLANGGYTFRVRATDAAGNTTSDTRDFSVDTVDPTVSITSGPEGPTNDSTPTFEFSVGGASTVECSIAGALGPCSGGDSHTESLSDSSYTFTVRATDAAGNTTSETRDFTVDTAAPTVSVTSGPSGPTNDSTPTFGFSVSGASTVECSIAGELDSCSGASSHTESLSDGGYTFTVRATDAAGNTSSDTRDFAVDTVDPSLSITSGPSGPTNDSTPTFGFSVSGALTVECSIEGQFGPCSGAGSHTESLSDGSYTFRVRASDAAGNVSTQTRGFAVDTVAPTVSVTSGPTGPTSDSTPTFGFSVNGATSVECSIAGELDSCSGNSSHTESLPDGDYTFTVQATDAAGNSSSDTRGFAVDTVDPELSITSGPDGATNDNSPAFGFSVSGASSVECSIAGQFGPCSSAGSHTESLSDGDYTFRVRAIDVAGNTSTETRDFRVDTVAPSLAITSGPEGQTNDSSPSFGFAASGGSTVECALGATDNQTEEQFGNCSGVDVHASGHLDDGDYTFRVRATDAVENTAGQFRNFSVDTIAPKVSVTSGPVGTTADNTPLFGFSAVGADVLQCAITPAYGLGPCSNGSSHGPAQPLQDGIYTFRVDATDDAGNTTSATRIFTVDADPAVPASPPPPVITPPPTVTGPTLMNPFPLVRLAGQLTSSGVAVQVLSVRAPRGSRVSVRAKPSCRSGSRCRVRTGGGTVGRKGVVRVKSLELRYRAGTVIVIRVSASGRIGKYTRFIVRRGKAPRRTDRCLMPGAKRGSPCPTS
jgi:hypothetical protein